MKNILKSKKGLSTVVTTLIILVVSVLLATVVTFYAINITTNRTQQESLYMSNLHVWYNTTGNWAEAAFVLTNTGGKDVVLQSITARSQPSDWSNVYSYSDNTITYNSLSPTIVQPSSASITVTYNGNLTQSLTQASGVITLRSGYTLVVYINHPDSVGQNDVGTPVSVTAFTANAQWTQEVNVQAAQ
ncbi:MAG TPA: hypothetical protein VMS95_07275 [Candidatus Krumholzibacteriaceae bacterium]|jgi:hypothetical protein|nr:hypothetical protein [Candidatus Krumholzibacteriaceae bacterium]